MNKVITINLNGKAYQLEEAGYEALHDYLQKARMKLDGNPDQPEIMKDFEQAIAEKCDKYLSSHKNVVTEEEVKKIITEMGPVAVDETLDSSDAKNASKGETPKRLYRIREGAWIAGVCNGIAVYFGMDVKAVRIIFVIFALFSHGGILGLYILMAFFVPAAETNEEKAFARGKQFNAQEFMEEMKEKYGKYADESYWKKYTESKKDYGTSVALGWVRFTRFGTGIITVIGSLVIAAIAIVYSIVIWVIIIHGSVFGKEILVGASPILLGLFVTAIAYAVIWPLKKIVAEARRHTWNLPNRKHPVKQVVGIIMWIVAIGFAVTIGLLSTADRSSDRAPYGVDFWIAHHEICIGGNYFCDGTPFISPMQRS